MDFSNDLLIKNNPADLVLQVSALNYDESEKTVTLLFDSSQNWETTTGENDRVSILGFWGSRFIEWLEHDMNIKCLMLQFHEIVNGTTNEFVRVRPFFRDGKKFRMAVVGRDGAISFLDKHEIL